MKKKSDSVLVLVVLFCVGLAVNGMVSMQLDEHPVADVAHMQLMDYQEQATN